jgi:hypothetical protein
MSARRMYDDEQIYKEQRIISDDIRHKLIKKLRKCSEIIDEMGHSPSRQHLEESIRFIIWELKQDFLSEDMQ